MGGVLVVSHLIGGIIADRLNRSNLLSRTNVRKLLEAIAVFGCSAQMMFIEFTYCDSTKFLLLMAGASLTYGMQAGGELPIVSDLTSRFSGTVFGIGNSIAMSSSFVLPILIGVFLDNNTHNPRHTWHMIFYFLAAFAMLGGLAFLIFIKAEPQDWDWEEDDEKESKE